MSDVKEKIEKILFRMRELAGMSDNKISRQDYMKEKGKEGLDWSFSLCADDIIGEKIGARVMGCTGVSKVFIKLAEQENLKVFVLTTADYSDWKNAANGGNNIINGHQIIAVETESGLKAFDPGHIFSLKFIPGDIEVGNFMVSYEGHEPYLITGIIPGEDFKKVDSYRKLRNLYTSGNMEDSNFKIVPNMKSLDSYSKNLTGISI